MQEGLDTLRVAEAVLKSADTRQIVEIAAS
jgi:hypothetical protein